MSKLILNHPKKAIIDSVCLQNISSRDKAKTLAEKHGISISHGVLAKYHATYLRGEIDTPDKDLEELEGVFSAPLDIDLSLVDRLASELNKDENSANSVLKRELSELLALQIGITKDALKKHISGVARYPTEYIRNLNIIASLLTK